MIDISQLVGNALKNLKPADAARNGADASAFHDALSRARDNGQQEARVAAPSPKPAAKPATTSQPKQADTSKGQDQGKNQPAQTTQAAQANPQKDAGSSADAKDANSDAKDGEDTTTVSADAAAAAAALAAAMLAQPANAAAVASGNAAEAAAAASLNGMNGLAGLNGSNGQNGLNGLPTAPATQAAATTTGTTADAAAALAQADAQTQTLAPAATVDTAAKATTPSPADTLATIAQQRAALQNTAPTTADKIAAAVTTQAPAAAATAQDARGQSGGQQHASLGQSGQPAVLQASNAQDNSTPAVTPFAAAQASARTGEVADTGATNASSAATLASAMAAQAPTHTAAAAAATAAARPVIAPNVGDGQWAQALGQQMVRLSTQGNQTAELDLNPPNLGPLKVVLNVVNDQAQAQFVSPHQAVRAAVEASLPHLRTSLAEAGIQLGQTSVGAESFAGQSGNGGQQQQRQASNGSAFSQATGFGNDTSAPAAAPAPRAPRTLARGEVDTFA